MIPNFVVPSKRVVVVFFKMIPATMVTYGVKSFRLTCSIPGSRRKVYRIKPKQAWTTVVVFCNRVEVGTSFRLGKNGVDLNRDGMEMLKSFLGREPTSDAFLKSIGLEETK